MIVKLLATAVVVVIIVAVVGGSYRLSKRGSREVRLGEPGRVSADLVSQLTAELRKWQAEAAYWKSTAERLQREADRRGPGN